MLLPQCPLLDDDPRFPTPRSAAQPISYLSQFNPQTSQSHLLIQSPQKLNVPIRPVAPPISASIQSPPAFQPKRIRDKTFPRQLRMIPVTARVIRSSNVNFPRNPYRNRLHRPIQNVNSHIPQWTSQRTALIFVFLSF